MLKIRLHGEENEIEHFLKFIEKNKKEITVLNESDFYKDRGKSVYIRKYIDVKFKNETSV